MIVWIRYNLLTIINKKWNDNFCWSINIVLDKPENFVRTMGLDNLIYHVLKRFWMGYCDQELCTKKIYFDIHQDSVLSSYGSHQKLHCLVMVLATRRKSQIVPYQWQINKMMISTFLSISGNLLVPPNWIRQLRFQNQTTTNLIYNTTR